MSTNERVWLVNTGLIDIFSIRLEEGQPVGTRRHLLRLHPGRFFCGIDSAQYGKERVLIAIGSAGSSVLQLERTRIQQLAEQSEFSAIGICALIDQWVVSLAVHFKQEMIPKDCRSLGMEMRRIGRNLQKSGLSKRKTERILHFLFHRHTLQEEESVQLKKGVNYISFQGVLWVRHKEGGSLFLGSADFPEIRDTTYFPVTEKTWLQALEPASLEYVHSLDIIADTTFWDALEQFHLFVIENLIRIATRERLTERARLKRKAEDENDLLQECPDSPSFHRQEGQGVSQRRYRRSLALSV